MEDEGWTLAAALLRFCVRTLFWQASSLGAGGVAVLLLLVALTIGWIYRRDRLLRRYSPPALYRSSRD